MIGAITPPVGRLPCVGCKVGGVAMSEVGWWIWPFVLATVAVTAAVAFIPAVSLWLPHALF